MAETLHERDLSQTPKLYDDCPEVKLILAGPSSSGENYLAQRLSIQFRVNDRPVAISLDDYFINR